MDLVFSIIIPVFNRPDELDELLTSLTLQNFAESYEVIVVEDGSKIRSEEIVKKYYKELHINYFFKENSGPGLSRNFGMRKAKGNYYIILDSDCILPEHYLKEVLHRLQKKYTDAFGGPDTSHPTFTVIQKAINYAMTSMPTTGGIRGNKKLQKNFQPRSFNMGISKKAFEVTGGFSAQRYGEDIDLTFRLWQNGLKTQYLENAFVYHKRRISWGSFFKQTFNFGAARPVLNKLYPATAKITYWFPGVFIIGLVLSIIVFVIGFKWLLYIYALYFIVVLVDSMVRNKSFLVAISSLVSTCIQFFGYGMGFLRSQFRLGVLQYEKEKAFPEMFV